MASSVTAGCCHEHLVPDQKERGFVIVVVLVAKIELKNSVLFTKSINHILRFVKTCSRYPVGTGRAYLGLLE